MPSDSTPSAPFTSSPSLSAFTIPASTYLSTHPHPVHRLDGVGAANAVFHRSPSASSSASSSPRQILLLRRAPHDSYPHRWELPGGGVDDSDASILHGAARELREESGLVAARYTHVIRATVEGTEAAAEEEERVFGEVFLNSRGTKRFCRFTFAVEVEGGGEEGVKLDPNEHQEWAWVTEEEVKDGRRAGSGEVLEITTDAAKRIILAAFEMDRERRAG